MSERSDSQSMARARWLNELAISIGEARLLIERFGVLDPDSEELTSLKKRLLAVATDIESLRRGPFASTEELHPKWISLAHWRGNLDPADLEQDD